MYDKALLLYSRGQHHYWLQVNLGQNVLYEHIQRNGGACVTH